MCVVSSYEGEGSYLGEGAVVPEVALVGKAVANEAELALLDILLDGVKELLLGDLEGCCQHGFDCEGGVVRGS